MYSIDIMNNGMSGFGSGRTSSKVVVTTGESANCKSILVTPKKNTFSLRLMGRKTRRDSMSASGKKLQWANDVDEAKIMASIPRRLTLQEKVSLYMNRPDLDLTGIMPRLEAIRRLENMTMMQNAAQNKSTAAVGSYFAYMNQPQRVNYNSEQKQAQQQQQDQKKRDELVSEQAMEVEEKKTDDDHDDRVEDEFFDCQSSTGAAESKYNESETRTNNKKNVRQSTNPEYRQYWETCREI